MPAAPRRGTIAPMRTRPPDDPLRQPLHTFATLQHLQHALQ